MGSAKRPNNRSVRCTTANIFGFTRTLLGDKAYMPNYNIASLGEKKSNLLLQTLEPIQNLCVG